MAAMNMVRVRREVLGGKLSFKNMSAGGRLCTLQENPHFRVQTIKVRPPDGMYRAAEQQPSLNSSDEPAASCWRKCSRKSNGMARAQPHA